MRTTRLSRVCRSLLAPAAALALGASLAACSVSFGGSGDSSEDSADSGDTTTETTSQDQGGSGVSGGNQDAADSASTEDPDDDATGSDSSDITDPGWQEVINNGSSQTVSGSYVVQGSGETLNLVGDLDEGLTIQGSEVTVAAQNVGTLTIQGSDVTVYVRSASTVTIAGSNVKVYWLSGSPSVTDTGSDNVATQIGQG